MNRFWNTAVLSVALLAPIGLAPTMLRAEPQTANRSYHDKERNDDHQWNGQEDKAYRLYNKESHRKANNFHNQKDEDQQNYWKWRHEHSDEVLKIKIR